MNSQSLKAPDERKALNDDLSYDDLLEYNIDLLDTNYFLKCRLYTEKRDLNLQLNYSNNRNNLLENIIIVLIALVIIIPTTILIN